MENPIRSEISLPKSLIHRIQHFMSGKEAARSSAISQSWGNAWLSRPSIVINDLDFISRNHSVVDFAITTLNRYKESGLTIENFTLNADAGDWFSKDIAEHLIVGAMERGATDLHLQLQRYSHVLPKQVLESETLVGLYLSGCTVDVDEDGAVKCSALKSLSLVDVAFNRDSMLEEIITCCSDSLEGLCLSNPCRSTLSLEEGLKCRLRQLERLGLHSVAVDSGFFSTLGSFFPKLKHLSLGFEYNFNGLKIASTSLETINLEVLFGWNRHSAQFDVPNIRKFNCNSRLGLPNIAINGVSKEWDLDISVRCNTLGTKSWCRNLKNLLKNCRLSKISLLLHLKRWCSEEDEVYEAAPINRIALEKLIIRGPSSLSSAAVPQLLKIFQPKLITYM